MRLSRILRLLFIRRNRTSEAARQLGILGAKARKERDRAPIRKQCDAMAARMGRPPIDWGRL